MKGIKKEFSVPRTPQQNGITERKNRTLIEDTRIMLADSLLPISFWAEAVNTACYVQNRVLVTKPQNKTSYELLHGRTPKKAGEESIQQYVLFAIWSFGSTNPQNTDGDAAFNEKEPEFEGRKPESEVNHDDKTKREAKGKSLVESSTGYRNLSAKFKDLSDNRINKDNTVGTLVPAVGQLSPNNTNTFSTAGPSNEEGIDYEEVFAPVARIKAIRLFLAYASSMGFMAYQMDVKSAFLYGDIKKEVYVCQPLGFEDPDYPDKFYKVVKALYGLHQASRAWYETLANYLLENGFQRGKIEQTLFIKRQKDDILLVQIYVDDIISGSTNNDLCKAFEKLMKDKFQMSSMGELTFFVDEKSASTPIDTKKPLLKDPDGKDADVHTYRSMIGSLMYLTSSRPDIMFAVCSCARFQVTRSHLYTVKRIFRYLKGKPHLGLGYSKDSPFNLVAYSDSDYAGASLDRKYATGGCQFLGYDAEGIECLPNEEIFTELAKMGYEKPSTKLTFYKAFFSRQWKFLIHIILQCMSAKRTLWNEFSSSMASIVICLSTSRKFNFSKYIIDSLVRHVVNPTKFYMYPRFLQLMIRKQVGDHSIHTTKYSSPALSQKVFANMRRVGKGFSGVETPLFDGMIVEQQVDEGANEVHDEGVPAPGVVAKGDISAADDVVPTTIEEPSIPSLTLPTPPPQPSQDQPSTS
nr:putative ribonuclease H-like domain-containing protein [Tanacetum cinerariifolium]